MALFNLFKRKKTFSNEEIEKEYQKAQRRVQKVENNYASLVRDIRKYAEDTCQPHEGDDLLAKKAEFMRIYAFRAYQWRCYHTLGYKKRKFEKSALWCQKWQNYEQEYRLTAQSAWRAMLSRTR